ncbi:ExbD/TolR family protein [Sphingomonas crusticola]|uniref:ExbD/TolR family protein n=1 Tax=Sphingomonas crusticola TaxID=1697973 RepID=UPI000E26723D|nr:biopolymer transporter ExbD [Sphingomonas crusticola]
MAMNSAGTDGAPMMDINTTPLIDVMLVLLMMFIITIPMQTHAVKLDTPSKPGRFLQLTKNEVEIDNRDKVSWNGAPVDLVVLRQYLDQTQMMDPIPELHVRPAANARFETVDNVLAVTKRAHVARMGIVGNEVYAKF